MKCCDGTSGVEVEGEAQLPAVKGQARIGVNSGQSCLVSVLMTVATVLMMVSCLGCQPAEPVEPFGQDSYYFAEGARLHYVTQGEGDPVVLLHDSGTWSYSWRKTLPELSKRYRTLALDLPGAGLSTKVENGSSGAGLEGASKDVIALLHTVGVRRAVLVGHGWGANVALYLAAQHPERVRGLVISGSWAFASDIQPPLLARLSRKPLVGAWACSLASGLLVRQHFAPLFSEGSEVMTPEWVAQVAIPMSDRGWCALLREDIYSPFDEDLAEKVGEVPVETLLLWGSEDRLAPVEAAEALAAKLPQAALQVFDGAGHMLHEERPAEFNKAVLMLLERTYRNVRKRARKGRVEARPGLPDEEVVATLDRECPCLSGEGMRASRARMQHRRCVRVVAGRLRSEGTITGAEQAALHRRATHSTCGRRGQIRCCRRSRCRITKVQRCVRLRGRNLGPGSCYPNPCGE